MSKILRGVFIVFVVLSLGTSALVITLSLYEMYLDQQAHSDEGKTVVVTHLFISLIMGASCNTLIVGHVVYITYYVLKGYRYKWFISLHYFCYVLLEIISVVCTMGKFDYLTYPLLLHSMTGVLAVFLFFFNYFSVQIHQDLEDLIKENKEKERNLKAYVRARKGKEPCVRISLKSGDDIEAGTSSVNSGKKGFKK
ncbi:uncharacterized protein LOC135137625 [Zophobas morio]|uniref:uncharacterized protein LOC135137625 n=1 Tax=Zophobas morio TaxID=2755281 RepID=UPI003082F202